MNEQAEPRFAVPLRRAMRREGLAGSRAEVRLQGDTLVLTGDSGGTLSIAAAEVERLRIAFHELPPPRFVVRPPSRLYQARIRRRAKRSLLVGPPSDRPDQYRAAMRLFAGWVFANGGEVLRGPGLAELILRLVWAIVPLTLIGLLLLGGAIVEGLVSLGLAAVLVLALPAFLVRRIHRRHWPRRVTRPEELDEVLPPPEEEA